MSWFNIEIPSLFKRNINGIDEIDQIDHALQEVIMKLEEQSYPALLVFRGGSRGG